MSKNRRHSMPESARDRREERPERKREGIGIRRLRVVRVEDITPRLRRIVLTGGDLGGFPFREFAPSDKGLFTIRGVGVV